MVMEAKLQCRTDGSFNILQFTDIHFIDGVSKEDIKTCNVIKNVMQNEDPDLIVLTGDTVYGEKNKEMLEKVIRLMDSFDIPWTFVFGNHDTEWGSSKEELFEVVQKSKNCLFQKGEPDIWGMGNYYLNVYGSNGDKPVWNLFFFDSGCLNADDNVEGYDFIKRDQINWYIKESEDIKSHYGILPALAFFHIPLQEYLYVWYKGDCYGEKNEEVCCANQNSGLFSAMLEMGNVKGIFVGHDHINDYYGDMFGIKLCYGRATGYNTYGDENFKKGARMIRLVQNKDSFDTWIRLEDGQKIIQNKKTNSHNLEII